MWSPSSAVSGMRTRVSATREHRSSLAVLAGWGAGAHPAAVVRTVVSTDRTDNGTGPVRTVVSTDRTDNRTYELEKGTGDLAAVGRCPLNGHAPVRPTGSIDLVEVLRRSRPW